MLLRLLPLAVLVGVAACDSTHLSDLNVSDLSHEPAALVGTWDLVSVTTSGDVRPPATTPVSDDRETYVFAADGTAQVFRDGALAETTTWSVRPDVPFSLQVGDRQETFGIDGDRLYFDDRPVDGGLFDYRRR